MKYFVTVEDREYEVDLTPDGIRVNGRDVAATVTPSGSAGEVSVVLDGRSVTLSARRLEKGRWTFLVDGRAVEVEALDERTKNIRAMAGTSAGPVGPRPVRAPMPGMVVRLEVEAGDHVRTGQGLVIVEAMKMENELKSETEATVQTIHVQAGQAVEKDQVLLEFVPVEAGGGNA